MTSLRRISPLLTAALLLLALTACDPGGSASPSPSASVGSSSPSSSPTPSSEPTDDSDDSGGALSAPCTRDSLTNEFEFTDGTAGHLHGVLTVGNMSGSPCSLSGYPTLYIGDPDVAGRIGAAANNDPADAGTPLELAPGDAAVANVTLTQAGIVEGCTIVDTDSFVYAPPGIAFDIETTAQHVYSTPFQGCQNDDIGLLTVGGFTAG